MSDKKVKFKDVLKMANMKDSAVFNFEELDEEKIKNILEEFKSKYIAHNEGFFIMAPSGVGKTYFCNNQNEPNWIDGDEIWIATGAHPSRSWWLEGSEVISEVDKRSDVVTFLAREMGYWIMGASNFWLQPDAIVIPDWEEHKKLIKYREENNYDGGAKSDEFDQVLSHREWIMKWSEKGTPVFKTIEEAVNNLTQLK